MIRLDFECGGAISIARDNTLRPVPTVNLRAYGRSGTTLLLPLTEREVLALVKALLAGGSKPSWADRLAELEALAVTR